MFKKYISRPCWGCLQQVPLHLCDETPKGPHFSGWRQLQPRLKRNLLLVYALLCIQLAAAQGIVNVNPLTGTPGAVIPIAKIGRGVSVPVNLVYNGSGVKVLDVEGTAGMGWNV